MKRFLIMFLSWPLFATTTYYIGNASTSPIGNDSNNGLSAAAPWLTPNHPVNCGDVIIAAPSASYSQSNFTWYKWGTVTCVNGNSVAWLSCAIFDACKMTIPSGQPQYQGGFNIDQSYWGITGWEVDSSALNSGPCFQAQSDNGTPPPVHHIIFANNIAVGCGNGGFLGSPDYDYLVMVGNIAYNTVQSTVQCYSALTAYGPYVSDFLPGTHIYLAGNFAWANVEPNPCGGGQPTDGQGLFLDTADANAYSQQIVIDNNMALFNGGAGVKAFSSTSGAHVYLRHNTTYSNELGNVNSISCGEDALQNASYSYMYLNLSQTSASATCYGPVNIPVLSVSQTITGDAVFQNYGYSVGGHNTAANGTGFSFAISNVFGDPQFVNPVVPSAPSCGGYPNVPACMAAVIANFTPNNPAARAYGYQLPSLVPMADSLFPQWLCTAGLPPGLISTPCIEKTTVITTVVGSSIAGVPVTVAH